MVSQSPVSKSTKRHRDTSLIEMAPDSCRKQAWKCGGKVMGICPVIHQGGFSVDCVGDYRHLSMVEGPHVSRTFCDRRVLTRWCRSVRDDAEQCVQRAVIGVLTFSVDVCGDGPGDKWSTASGDKGTILGSLKIVLVVSCSQIYRVPFALMMIGLVETNNVVTQIRRDEVIAPVVDHGIVDCDVMVKVVMLYKVFQGRQNLRLPNDQKWIQVRIYKRSSTQPEHFDQDMQR